MSDSEYAEPSGSAWIDRPDTDGVWWLCRKQCRGLFFGDDQVKLVFIDGPRMSFDRRTWYTTARYLKKQPEARWLRIVKPSPPNDQVDAPSGARSAK